MVFSFNPNSGQAPSEAVAGAAQPSGMQPVVITPIVSAADAAALPDSPFLFIKYRGRDKTVVVYLQIILIAFAILSVCASVVFFSYGLYLSSRIEKKQTEILALDATFKEYPIEDMKRLSNRMAALNGLMKDYVSARSPLRFLEDVVEKQVLFNQFALVKNQQSAGYLMNFTIITTNYRSLIQQLEALNLAQYSKVVPQSKIGSLVDNTSSLKIRVSAPIFAQGVLSDDIVFVQPSITSSSTSSQNGARPVVTGSSTP